MHHPFVVVHHDGGVLDHALRRKQLGAWYTPAPLVEHVLDEVLEPFLASAAAGAPGDEVSVLDPACGDARFLAAAARRIRAAGRRPRLVGVDIDADALLVAADVIGVLGCDHELVHADALAGGWSDRRFDVVVGNPPFLSPLASAHGVRLTDRAGGPYADAAAEFLALALRVVRPDGGRIGLVLPLSIVASRDASPMRDTVDGSAPLEWFWFAPRPVFDAEVRTCAVGLVAGASTGPVRRSFGKLFAARAPITPPAATHEATWSWLLADQLGIPALPALATEGVLGDLASATADFRDEYYGLEGALLEDDGGGRPRLVTSGLIDAGVCHWGERPTRVHRQVYQRPVVATDRLSAAMQRWVEQRAVPKVLVASQTKVIEAVADADGSWLPGVPVVTVTPHDPARVWELAAVLTGPVPSVWLAARASGSGMSAGAMRIAAPVLARLPLPAASLTEAAERLRAGDIEAAARAATLAYGVDAETADALMGWWLSASRGRPATGRPARP